YIKTVGGIRDYKVTGGQTCALPIYVGDDGNHRIVRMDDMTGKNLTMLGTEGGDPKQFRLPWGIFVDTAGKIYVADAGNHYIIRKIGRASVGKECRYGGWEW